jgi:long-chain acyl-CoA synthetase
MNTNPRQDTIYNCFRETVERFPNLVALMYKQDGKYTAINYQALSDYVDAVAEHLKKLGVTQGDSVGIYSYNRPEWVMVDLAVLKLGAVVVPIYHVMTPFYIKYIVNDAKIKMLFVENAVLYEKFATIKAEVPLLQKVVLFDPKDVPAKTDYLKFEDFKKLPDKVHTPSSAPDVLADDVATIVYTSGTTGEPKGVMLTHLNITTNALAGIERFHLNEQDIMVSYLPLSHMFERTCGYYVMIFCGGAIAYAENFSTVVLDIGQVCPTLLVALPRVLEKAYETGRQKIASGSFIQRMLVNSAIKNLNRYYNLKYRGKLVPRFLKIKCNIYDKLVASKFRQIAGGRLRLLVSGGAPLNKQVGKIFAILGFNIYEWYGLTETAPIISSTMQEDNRLGTVGKPIPDVQIKIGANSEILTKGLNLMLGYHNKPEETRKVIDNEGWFHTGDQGQFDRLGNLIITGRIKELIVTSYGKKVAPIPIEEKICSCGYVEQVMIYGDKKNFLVALVVPNRKTLERHAQKHNITCTDFQGLCASDDIKTLIENEIEKATTDLAPYEKIKAFTIIPEGFTIDNDMLTPTLKLRRNKVLEKYKPVIEAMYVKSTEQ